MGPLGHCLLTLPYLLIHLPQLLWFLLFSFCFPGFFCVCLWVFLPLLSLEVHVGVVRALENAAEGKAVGLTLMPPSPPPLQSSSGGCPVSNGVSFRVRGISGFEKWLLTAQSDGLASKVTEELLVRCWAIDLWCWFKGQQG